jgi:hypothetical protein
MEALPVCTFGRKLMYKAAKEELENAGKTST